MDPKRTTLRPWLLLLLVLGGLVLAGQGHAGLHDEDHGAECSACDLVGSTAPELNLALAPVPMTELPFALSTTDTPHRTLWSCAAPRGPPATH